MCVAAFWNWAMVATARFVPVKILTDRAKIRAFAKKTNPVIKLVDPLIGEKVTHSSCLLWYVPSSGACMPCTSQLVNIGCKLKCTYERSCQALKSLQWLGCHACLGVGHSTSLTVAGLP